jgi:small subunit ribosomal protein S4
VIAIKEKSRTVKSIEESVKTVTRRGIPEWLEVNVADYNGTIKAVPTRQDLPPTIREQLIVEFYSK